MLIQVKESTERIVLDSEVQKAIEKRAETDLGRWSSK